MKKSYTVFYITRSPGYGGYGYEVLSFEGTKEEFLDVISKIILTKYGKKGMCSRFLCLIVHLGMDKVIWHQNKKSSVTCTIFS